MTIADATPTEQVTIRAARAEDAAAVRRLAALDSAPVPAGPLLVAEADGELRAARVLETGATIADPFFLTRHLVALLEVAAAEAREPAPRDRRSPLRIALAMATSPRAFVRAG